jgi:uncharacterized protein (TIGR03435 family)
VQNLLVERFKLASHRETKWVSGYVLEIAKNGLKIRPSGDPATPVAVGKDGKASGPLTTVDQNGFPAPRPGNAIFLPGAAFQATISVDGKYRATALNSTMPEIAAFLARFDGLPGEDRTGLNGKYDVHLEFAPNASNIADPGPGLLDAVQAQLGLKLTPKKVPVEMLVVDHLEKVPTEN